MKKDARSFRRQLRKDSTPPEKVLWAHLRNRRLGGLKFRRQESLGNFVVDFLNFDTKIIIEVDGDIHFITDENVARDKLRQAWLEKQGYLVLRYNNVDIGNNLENILAEIYNTSTTRMKLRK